MRQRYRCLAIGVMAAAVLPAQQFTPHIGYIYPSGGRQGVTLEVTVGGQFLDGVNNAYVTGSGVQALVVNLNKLMTQGQANRLRDQMQELMEKRQKTRLTPEEERTITDIRLKLSAFIRRPATPAVAERTTVRITIAADAAPGERELRLATPAGLTNPMMFCVGQLPEFSKEPAKIIDETVSQGLRFRPQDKTNIKMTPMPVTLPAVINGQIMPGAIDRFKFPAAKGQRLVIATAARELIPYISDAVPGWFQATLALYDAKGKEVGYADHYRFHPDPVLYYEIPDDGEYTIEIHDSIFRGREDFVYRITAGELPYVTGIFPLGGKTGAKTSVEVKGWNLPVSKLAGNTKEKGVRQVRVTKAGWESNPLPFVVDTLPEKNEKEPNNQVKRAQSVKLPVVINGRIDQPGDLDVFKFDGKAGEEIIAEVFARRLESPLDSLLRLTDAAGKQLAINDDFQDKGAALITHQADSLLRCKLPRNGAYYLHVADTQHQGGAEYVYRLRISRPQPDFELRVVPSSINARPGATIPITVYALRRDGFAGDIALKLKDAPPGFVLSGALIPASQDSVRLTLTVPVSRIEKPRPMGLEGRATIAGKEVHRLGVPAEDMMQAFFYHHLVPSTDWLVRVTGANRAMPAWKVSTAAPVKLPASGTAQVRVFVPLGRLAEQLRFTLNEPPEGIAIQKVSVERDGLQILLRADPAKVKPGLRGNLIVDAAIERETQSADKKKTERRRQAIGMLPAIPFEVVGG